jgi:polyprenyl-phospho-N-acetylgalactosaminyl synthase
MNETASQRSDLWIVVPAYNEATRIDATLRSLAGFQPRVVVVDDGSRDGTLAFALQHRVFALRHSVNCGQGAALQTGIDFALAQHAEYIVTFDADGQHSPDDIGPLLAPLLAGTSQVALGSRFLGQAMGIPWSRRALLKLGVAFTRIVSRMRVTDVHNGLRAFSRAAAVSIRIQHDGMAHASEILDQVHRAGLRYCEVPVSIRYTAESIRKGQSSWNALHVVTDLVLGRICR